MRERFPSCFRFLMLLASLVLLSHCSTPHQPLGIDPYFSSHQAAYTGSDLLSEVSAIEKKEALGRLERKRLYDLYQAELSYLKPGSSRHASVTAAAAKLKPETESWDAERAEIERETREENKKAEVKALAGPRPLSSPEYRKLYSEVMQLWNKEQQDQALVRLDSLMQGGLASASAGDRNKFLQIGFRIALERADLSRAGKLFSQMQENEGCGYETNVSGFLYSLTILGEGRDTEALKLFESLCEIEDSPAERIRRDYWLARMMAKTDPPKSKELFEKIAGLPIPGYHTFFALYHLERKYEVPTAAPDVPLRPYLTEAISVPEEIHMDWLAAEERLRFNLRRDAQTFLLRVSAQLRREPSESRVPAMLYTAHLFHAAGNHLEAMRLYSEVATVLASDYDADRTQITPTVLGDMFPRPSPGKTEWLSHLWDMDPDYVYAIARQESAFNPTAVSATDARGWMQLMPPLAKSIAKSWGLDGKFNEKYLFHVDENLKFGVFHLRQLRDLLGHPALMAGAYNAGASRAVNWQKRYGAYPLDIFVELVPINETRNYIKLVLRNFFLYKGLRFGAVDPKIISFQLAPKPSLP